MKRAPRWVVTRQKYWPDGNLIVEVASGGRDYCNPDALVQHYPGEFQEFTDPREACCTALDICRRWRADLQIDPEGNERKYAGTLPKVAHGATGGMTMPFDACTFDELQEWADKVWESLPKCEECGSILGDERYGSHAFGEYDCCSEYCAEERYASQMDEEAA